MKTLIATTLIATLLFDLPAQARDRVIVQHGVASFYADRFHGRIMADGGRFNRNAAYAASRTLPLGTVAKVTNLRNGRQAVVRIRDRGPYVGRRIIDLSPATASNLGFRNEGLAPVRIQVAQLAPRRR